MDARSAPRDIEAAVAALGDGAFTEQALATHVAPLFAHALAVAPERVYLANPPPRPRGRFTLSLFTSAP